MKRCYICNSTEHENYNNEKITTWFYIREEIRCNVCQELIDNDLLESNPEFEFTDERKEVLEEILIETEVNPNLDNNISGKEND